MTIASQGASLDDVQARRPETRLTLTRVGVTAVEKVLRLDVDGAPAMLPVELECFVDLAADQRGAHMSRFEEVVNDALEETADAGTLRPEALAGEIAERIRDRQGGARAEVELRARRPERRLAPASGSPTQEISTVLGTAVASSRGTRRLIGVEVSGMTACPCAQELLAGQARDRLADQGFAPDDVERILDAVPVATHNQRGIARLEIGCPEDCGEEIRAERLLRIAEAAMSSETYELMKRSDEAMVVEHAHRNARFVEDCVREMVRMAAAEYRSLGPGAFVRARQENLETIHRHSVVAERQGLLGEIETELAGGPGAEHHVHAREWLDGLPAPVASPL